MKTLSLFVLLLVVTQAYSWLGYPPYRRGWVISEEETENTVTKNEMAKDPLNPPKIKAMEISTDISNRYAKTTYKSSVFNPSNITQETTFFVVTPDEAYITAFVMNIDGKNYNATVKEKQKAENMYNQAVNTGQSAAQVSVSTRNANKFIVSVNIAANSTAVFFLSCEELLKRKGGKYYHTTNINPKQLIEDLTVLVNIREEINITTVEILPLSSGEGMNKNNENLTVHADLVRSDSKSARIRFNPTIEEQKKFATALGTNEIEGLSGQFIVTYDVDRSNSGGEILMEDGYFTHFFAPADLPVKPKYLIFVVDTSGSMSGTRIQQLRETLTICLKNLNPNDRITIIEFNTNIKVYNLDAFDESTIIKLQSNWEYNRDAATYREHQVDYSKLSFPPAYPPTEETIQKALNAVNKMQATESTNIYESLRAAMHMVKLTIERTKFSTGPERQPIILFCTDGEPTEGLTNTKDIVSEVTRENIHKVALFSMSFGDGCDKEFLRSLSGQNYGISRHIYEAADSTMQMEDFFKQISSPLLSNVTFKYTDNVTEHTTSTFPILFRGGEFVVSGKINSGNADILPMIECVMPYPYPFVPVVRKVKVGNIERQWAYLTTKQYIEKNETAKALKLALDYSFVTPLTSMVVVKPNATEQAVNAVDAKSNDDNFDGIPYGGLGGMNKMSMSGYAPMMTMARMPMRAFMKSAPIFAVADMDDDAGLAGTNRSFEESESESKSESESQSESISKSESYGMAMGGMVDDDTDMVMGAILLNDNTDREIEELLIPLTTKKPEVAMTLPVNISTAFPFLQECITPMNTINFLKGNYKFGFDRSNTTVSKTTCTTLASEPGMCRFLDEATSVYKFITDKLSFQQFFCAINDEFIGLCCEKNSP